MKNLIIYLFIFFLMSCSKQQITFYENRELINDEYIKINFKIKFKILRISILIGVFPFRLFLNFLINKYKDIFLIRILLV